MQRGPRHPFQRARLRYDPSFAFELEYCFDHGIPYSEFLERWDPDDRVKLAAVAMARSDRCPKCGTSASDWDEDPYAYEPMFHTCVGCMKRELLEADDTPRPKGTSIRLVPKATAAKMRARAAEGIPRPRLRRP